VLDLFERFAIRATWATVGFIFCETKDELLASLPELRPTYQQSGLSNYRYLAEIGDNERVDPYFFGAALLRQVRGCPGQEIGTHTFSHFYCLEPGQTTEQFSADLDAAIAVAERHGVALRSLVFPRNQYAPEHLALARQKGLSVFRGNERAWFYRPTEGAAQTRVRRAGRLIDNYINLSGHHVRAPAHEAGMADVPASRFLRPFSTRLGPLQPLQLARITRAMTAAATSGAVFHLWWHPHNFGRDTDENLKFLARVLSHFAKLRDEYGMQSASMGEFC
jgi:peptidoglycan/xylan/chitin deacetylase (PgdA/CDA1 family)